MALRDFDWRATVSAIAPALGTALGGPLGGLAGGMVAKALGAPANATDSDLELAAHNATPDQLLALKKADQDFEAHLADLNVQLEDIAAKDRSSAREAMVASHSYTPAVLTCGITIGFFGLLGLLIFRTVPPESRDLVNLMIGSLGTAWITSISFWFGTTREGGRKTELLAQSSPAK